MLKKGSWKSANRNPLGDISNGGRPSRDGKKKIQLDRDDDGGYFDRLLLVRSKLSALVNQIDEIFAESSEHDMKSKTTKEEIESLTNLLSEMHSSLKPWALKLSQSQTASKTEVQACKSLQMSHNSKLDLIISPSPLVAWRAGGCKIVTEKQLFLLTPLSRKEKLSFKIKARNLCLKNSDAVSETVEEFVGSKPCGVVEERNMGKTRLKNQSEEAYYQKNKSNGRRDEHEEALEWFLSPPKTCTLMDPNHGSRKNDLDGTLEWFLSPPKTCALMNPLMEGKKIPSTPGLVDDSALQSRRAGETTLKKELWTKFQAVSRGRIIYRDSVLQKEGKKGFLDMLEEAT